jgi:hypothetical protein
MKTRRRPNPVLIASAVMLLGVGGILGAESGCSESETGGRGGSSGAAGGAPGSGAGGMASCSVTAADCPPGSANEACLCIPGSMPCFGLDETRCTALATKASGALCEAIYGSHDYQTDGNDGQVYLGCKTYDGADVFDIYTCAHPEGDPYNCAAARDSDLPDGWVECAECECRVRSQVDCPNGSGEVCCCADFPNSLPCEGLDEGLCDINRSDNGFGCVPIIGKVWDPTSQQGVGSKIYLGCRSTCVPEQPHGQPTCVHLSTDATACDVTNDGRIPDGWSTDCSACVSPN